MFDLKVFLDSYEVCCRYIRLSGKYVPK